jgi:hypothetical protein
VIIICFKRDLFPHIHSYDEHCYVTLLEPEDVCFSVSLFHYEDDDEDDYDNNDVDNEKENGMAGCDAHFRDV